MIKAVQNTLSTYAVIFRLVREERSFHKVMNGMWIQKIVKDCFPICERILLMIWILIKVENFIIRILPITAANNKFVSES
jgi:hypothetical protein